MTPLRNRGSLDQLFVVTHPDPIEIEARPIEDAATPEGTVALGYFHDGGILARGVVAQEAMAAITGLLQNPVSVALAAAEDADGNIEARVCLVLPLGAVSAEENGEAPDEPWKQSVPTPPLEIEDGDVSSEPKLALLPIGNVVRGAGQRLFDDVVGDARDMLNNLLAGRGRDAVQQAIDDLLDSI